MTEMFDQLRQELSTPFDVAYEDGSKEGIRLRFRVGLTNKREQKESWIGTVDPGPPTLMQFRINFRVTVEPSGALQLRKSSAVRTDAWRDGESPHLSGWFGEVNPSRQIWIDDDLRAAELALDAGWAAAEEERKAHRNLGQSLYLQLCKDWERRHEELLHSRFLEDFGDDSLWEGHRKALRNLSYP